MGDYLATMGHIFLLLICIWTQSVESTDDETCTDVWGGASSLDVTAKLANQTELRVPGTTVTQHVFVSNDQFSRGRSLHLVVKWSLTKQLEFADSIKVVGAVPAYEILENKPSLLSIKFARLKTCQDLNITVEFYVDRFKKLPPGETGNVSLAVTLEYHEWSTCSNTIPNYAHATSSFQYYAPECSPFGPLGMSDGRIKESQLSSSSYMKTYLNQTGNAPHFARPSSPGFFTVEDGFFEFDKSQFLQIDFRNQTKVEMVSIRGANGGHVTSFKVMFSDDNVMWKVYKERRTVKPKVFEANSDSSSEKTVLFRPSITAQLIRIIPQSWHRRVGMAVEFYGCYISNNTNAPRPLGMESGAISSSQILVSSGDGNQSRLNLGPSEAWCFRGSDAVRKLTIDLKKEYYITQVSVQGKMCLPDDNECDMHMPAEFFYLAFDHGWPYLENGQEKRFQGNQVDHVITHNLIVPHYAREVTFDLRDTPGTRCMRVEIYGRESHEQESVPIIKRGFLIVNDANLVFVCFGEYDPDEQFQKSTCFRSGDTGRTWKALDPRLLTILAFDSETKLLYGVSKNRRLYMESKDMYGHEWLVVLNRHWVRVRQKSGVKFVKEVPFIPATRFTKEPAPELRETDAQGNIWGGSSLGLHVFLEEDEQWFSAAMWWTPDIGKCFSYPCLNNGTCNELSNGYTCSCTQGFFGDHCEEGMIMDSIIVSGNSFFLRHLQQFLKPISSGLIQQWSLCWRGTLHGWDLRDAFNDNCRAHYRTVTIIKVGEYVFGGYAKMQMSCCGMKNSPDAFIFSLRNKEGLEPFKTMVKKGTYSILTRINAGPTFGEGHDLFISNRANSNADSYSNFGISYPAPDDVQDRGTVLAGSIYFTPDEIEVLFLA